MNLPLRPDSNKIIVAPLNWGLGHATRSIAIIDHLLKNGKEVFLASDGEALEFLKERYPDIISVPLQAYKVHYKKTTLLGLIISNSYRVLKAIIKERKQAKRLVSQFGADMIISDSRFGFRSSESYNIIVSHQLNLKAKNPIIHFLLNYINSYLT